MKILYTIISFLTLSGLFGQDVVNIIDSDINAGQSVNWTNDKVYLLDGLVFVEDGATLTIEAGTVVKFTERADVGNPSALIIARGGKIYAEGTAENPIIFTAEQDDVNDPSDLGPKDNALWGGIVILGKGVTQKNGNAEVNVEGIPTTESRGVYGGTDNADDSGVLKYVSIRHGGRLLSSGNELNGLTLAGVGSKTKLEYIEVYANSDDGIEFFGGAANLKYAVVAFAEDDSYDWDEVYTGKGQFWFSVQRDDIADAGGECDGTTPDDLTPYSNPTVYNWTHIGSGAGAAASNPIGWNLRAGTAGTIANSVLTEMKGKLIEVQDKAAGVNDAYSKLVAGELKILNNVLHRPNGTMDGSSTGIIRVSSTAEDATAGALITHLTNNKNSILTPNIVSVSRSADEKLDPRVCKDGAAYTTELAGIPTGDDFYTQVDFKGAFSANWDELWIRDWTTLARNKHLPGSPINCSVFTLDENVREYIHYYPNPASGNVVIENQNDKVLGIQIMDLFGRTVMNAINLPSFQKIEIPLNHVQSGVYFIGITTEGGQILTKKLIVE